MYLTMLGTGNAITTKCYNTCFLLQEKEDYFMVDGGGGNQILRILEEKDISWTKIHDVFLTHSHSDHIFGVIWVIRKIGQLMYAGKYEGNLRIYAHGQAIEDLKAICNIVLVKKVTDLLEKQIEFIVVEDGDSYTILGREVTFFDIQSKKLRQYGFEIGSENLLFCGDEPLKEELQHKAQDRKYLLHEAFCLYSEREKFKPYEKHHSTVKDVCCMAEAFNVENLILMHTEDSHIEERKQLYTQEGQNYFSGNLFVPEDGETIFINNQ